MAMKKLLLVILLGTSALSYGVADENCKTCKQGIRGMPADNVVAALSPLADYKPNEAKLLTLAFRICSNWSQVADVAGTTHNLITTYIKDNHLGGTTDLDVLNFLNTNKDYLQCEKSTNFFKVAIFENKYQSLFYKYIAKKFRKTNPKFDFNVVDIVNEQPETILDYIDSLLRGEKATILTPKYVKDVKKLRRLLVKMFEAKNFEDLPLETRNKYPVEVAKK